jgi:hypothetical protein
MVGDMPEFARRSPARHAHGEEILSEYPKAIRTKIENHAVRPVLVVLIKFGLVHASASARLADGPHAARAMSGAR